MRRPAVFRRPAADQAVAAGAANGRLHLLDARSGKSILSWHGHAGEVRWARFLAEPGRLATFGADGRLLVWETTSAAAGVVAEGPPGLDSALLSPDGRKVAAFPGGEGAAVVAELHAIMAKCTTIPPQET